MIRETVTAEQVQAYAADPMTFFADTVVPTAGGDTRLGDCWAEFQEAAFRVLNTCLLAIAFGQKPPYRGIWIERTKGGSKDSDVGLGLLWLLMFSQRPQVIELGADDLDQIMETYKAMVAIVRCNPWMNSRLAILRNKIVCEATGSECLFLTRDASGSHGSRPTVSVCNELSHCNDGDFIATMMDNADKIPNNLAIIATNAGELQTWQHRWRENYRTDSNWWFQKVETPAPWIDPIKVADAERRNPPGRFKRLWRGIWVSAGGDSLSADAIERCITQPGPLWERQRDIHTVCGIGVDAGIATHHAAVVVVVGRHFDQKLQVARVVDIPPPCRLERIRDEIYRQADAYCTRFVSLDPWQMLRVAEELVAAGFSVEAEHQTGNVLVKQCAALTESIRDGVLELYPDPLFIEDLYSARIVEKTYGARVELAENENGHSDRLAALLTVLPHCLEALGRPYCQIVDDGLGDNLLRAVRC